MEILLAVKSKADNSVQSVKHQLDGRLLLGRGPDSPVQLDGTGISREHFAIDREDSGLFVTDLSTNGTWVNGTRIARSRKCKIAEQDSIEVPGYELRYRILNGSREQAAETSAAKSGKAAPSAVNQANFNPSRGLSILDSFTALEKFVMMIAAFSVGLLLLYWNS